MYLDHVADLVRSGAVPMSIVDDAVRRILLVKFQLGLFERPYVDEQHEAGALLTAENRAAAREIAQKSIVLLRNEGNALPLPNPSVPLRSSGLWRIAKPICWAAGSAKALLRRPFPCSKGYAQK